MTIDNEQLTIVVSLWDEFEMFFISEGNSLIVNCQLSIVNSFPLLFSIL